MNLSGIVAGATGACGIALVKRLIQSPNFSKVTVLVRKQSADAWGEHSNSPKLKQVVCDFDKLEQYSEEFKGQNAAFCVLGTTRGQAGTDGFIKVDYTYCIKFAELSKSNGIEHYNLLTASSSDPNSWFLYVRVKGETERDTKKLNFKRLDIYQPGMLDRGDKVRATERLLVWVLPKSLLTTGEQIGSAMLKATIDELNKHENKKEEGKQEGTSTPDHQVYFHSISQIHQLANACESAKL